MMSHADASELLGAYALDAVEADEAAAIDEHLRTCPRCRDELRGHREVVGLLAYAGQEAPEGLWDRVVARINDPAESATAPAAVAPPESLRMIGRTAGPPAGPTAAATADAAAADAAADAARAGAPADAAAAGAAAAAPAGRPTRPWGRFSPVLALVAAAAVVVVALLGVEVARLQNRTDDLSREIASMADAPTMTTVQRALATPGAKVVALRPRSGRGASLGAVILPSGQGYLYNTRLDPLSAAQTYQLWGVVGTEQISYGVLGSAPAPVMSFRASRGVLALAVTAEVAGGVVASSHNPVVVGALA